MGVVIGAILVEALTPADRPRKRSAWIYLYP
jgi:hypothetical protein